MVRLLVVLLVGCGGAHAKPDNSKSDNPKFREAVAQCDRGDAEMCRLVAAAYEVGGPGIPQDPVRSTALRERANDLTFNACMTASEPDRQACKLLVISIKLAFEQAKGEDERTKLTHAFVMAGTRSCQAGNFDTCIDVAAVFHKGDGVPVDRGRARELIGFACTRGHQPACVELAVDLVNDPTDPRDRARAGELLEAACKKSDPDGCEMLATFRLSEPGAVGAREAAQRSCELGDPGGCAVYGHTLRDAIGGPADPSGARTAFETACRGKDWRGCQELGQ